MTDPDMPGAGPGGLGGLDLGSLLGAANQMMAAQAEAAGREVVGSAGGGLVEIGVTGGGEFTGVRIQPGAVDASDVPMLEDLVLAALRDAMAKVQQLQSGAMGGLDLASLGGGLGGLGGLLGMPGLDDDELDDDDDLDDEYDAEFDDDLDDEEPDDEEPDDDPAGGGSISPGRQ